MEQDGRVEKQEQKGKDEKSEMRQAGRVEKELTKNKDGTLLSGQLFII